MDEGEEFKPNFTTVGKESGTFRRWVECGDQTRKYGTFISCLAEPVRKDAQLESIIRSLSKDVGRYPIAYCHY
jgi:hypothetical protein